MSIVVEAVVMWENVTRRAAKSNVFPNNCCKIKYILMVTPFPRLFPNNFENLCRFPHFFMILLTVTLFEKQLIVLHFFIT